MAFEEGAVYKIASVVDGAVLDLADCSTGNGADIVTWSFGGSSNQLWKVTKADAGWTLSSMLQSEDGDDSQAGTKCMDQDLKKGTVLHFLKHGAFNQQWYTEEVTPGVNMHHIKSIANNKSLTSHGNGKKVTCEKADKKNSPSQNWVISLETSQ